MKKTWTVIAMLAALCCASCNDDNDDKASCTDGQRICSANGVRQECINGEYVSLPCPSGRTCSSGVCVSPLECDPNTTKPVCAGEHMVKYCSESKWTYATTDCGALSCANGPNGAYCDPTSVAPDVVCNQGAQRCTATGAHQVCSNNAWVDSPCGAGKTCKAGECVSEGACKEGATRCAADEAVQKCENGEWRTVSVCNQPGADACINGACTTKPACPSEGDACNAAGDVLCCEDNAFVCNNSKKYVIVETCENGSTCDTVEEYGVIGCVSETCKADEVGYFMTYGEACYEDMTFDLYACLTGDSGVNGIFPAAYASGFCADKDKKLSCNSQGKVVVEACSAADCKSSQNQTTGNYEASCTMDGSGSGSGSGQTGVTYTLCPSDCKVQGGQTCAEACKAESASSTCVLDSDNYIECSETCSKAGDTTPLCLTQNGAGFLLNQVCTDVDGKLLYITDYENYSQCNNGCNSAGTGCK
ncbi:MAG: hypothetical protein IJ165_00155 [Proteobacteria bacterium]|nr:hypothetical protein [Pseudomonadota bacterium]